MTTPEGLYLPQGEGRVLALGPNAATFKATGENTHGHVSVFEFMVMAGTPFPPTHRHHTRVESFYILDGELTVRMGERTVVAGSGAYVLIPRSVVHTIGNAGSAPTRFLMISSPSSWERYLDEAAAAAQAAPGGQLSPEAMMEIMARHDVEFADLPSPP